MDVLELLKETLEEQKTYNKDELKSIVKNIIQDIQLKALQKKLIERIKRKYT